DRGPLGCLGGRRGDRQLALQPRSLIGRAVPGPHSEPRAGEILRHGPAHEAGTQKGDAVPYGRGHGVIILPGAQALPGAMVSTCSWRTATTSRSSTRSTSSSVMIWSRGTSRLSLTLWARPIGRAPMRVEMVAGMALAQLA